MKQQKTKFRAWDKIEKRMLQVDKMYWNLAQDKICIICSLDETSEIALAVDEFNLLQFTGLLDKNGKEIYIGDIVFSEDGEYSKTMEIKEREDCLGINFNGIENRNENYDEPGECGDEDNLKIIGNIFQNKDLLK